MEIKNTSRSGHRQNLCCAPTHTTATQPPPVPLRPFRILKSFCERSFINKSQKDLCFVAKTVKSAEKRLKYDPKRFSSVELNLEWIIIFAFLGSISTCIGFLSQTPIFFYLGRFFCPKHHNIFTCFGFFVPNTIIFSYFWYTKCLVTSRSYYFWSILLLF